MSKKLNPSGLCQCGCGEKTSPVRWARDGYKNDDHRRYLPNHDKRLGLAPPNPGGLCQCGCGERTSRAKKTSSRYGHVKGEHVRFVVGHGVRGETRENHRGWKGGRRTDAQGYVKVLRRDHPRAHQNGYVYEHILVAEEALGKPLPEGVEVHHVNGDKGDNRNKNLVVCEDRAYHRLLHVRQRDLRGDR